MSSATATPAPAPLLGLAHVASCSFLASRIAPSGHFWIALGGGVALARAGERHGLRAGYGASLAAVVQTVALIGPARVSGPLTQALNAPLIGRMQGRGASRAARLAACLGIRLLHYVIVNVAWVLIVVGGVDAFVRTYDRIAGFTHVLPTGGLAAAAFIVIGALVSAVFYSTVQVLAYERALERWPAATGVKDASRPLTASPRPRLSARVLLILGSVTAAWLLMLALPSWPLLGGVALALAIAWAFTRRFPREVVVLGLILAGLLAVAALVPALVGAVDLDDAARRAIRAALLVLTATWARVAIGAPGVRAAARAALWRARRLPAAAEAAAITDGLESDTRLAVAGRALLDRMSDVPTRPAPVADALTGWVAAEAAAYESP